MENILGFTILFILLYIIYCLIFVMDKNNNNQDFYNEPFL